MPRNNRRKRPRSHKNRKGGAGGAGGGNVKSGKSMKLGIKSGRKTVRKHHHVSLNSNSKLHENGNRKTYRKTPFRQNVATALPVTVASASLPLSIVTKAHKIPIELLSHMFSYRPTKHEAKLIQNEFGQYQQDIIDDRDRHENERNWHDENHLEYYGEEFDDEDGDGDDAGHVVAVQSPYKEKTFNKWMFDRAKNERLYGIR